MHRYMQDRPALPPVRGNRRTQNNVSQLPNRGKGQPTL